MPDLYGRYGELTAMQAIISIPSPETLNQYGSLGQTLMQEVCGVPLLVRVIKTAIRAGADSLLIIWPSEVPQSIWLSAQRELARENLCGIILIQAEPFEPCQKDNWLAVSPFLDDEFLWLPWNCVTHKRALAILSLSEVPPADWSLPIRIQTNALIGPVDARVEMERQPEGVPVTSRRTAAEAKRLVIAGSGKLLDGVYSTFNRHLCRPIVRLLCSTPVTPNALTLASLAVGIASCWAFTRGFYSAYVSGAVLFFLSGLCDEMDGMLARIKFRESAFGTWFKDLVDNATYLLVFVGMTIGLHRQFGRVELIWGIALIAGSVLSVVVINLQRNRATHAARLNEYVGKVYAKLDSDLCHFVPFAARYLNVFLKKAVTIHYLLLFTLFGGLTLFFRLAAIGANLTWILTIYFSRRFFRRAPAAVNAEVQTTA